MRRAPGRTQRQESLPLDHAAAEAVKILRIAGEGARPALRIVDGEQLAGFERLFEHFEVFRVREGILVPVHPEEAGVRSRETGEERCVRLPAGVRMPGP